MKYSFNSDQVYGMIGSNGSGKSTLMKMLSGFLSPSKGQIQFVKEGKLISRSELYHTVSFAAPYVSLLKSLSIEEMISFAFKFKKLRSDISIEDFYVKMNLLVSKSSLLTELSSGQLQRLTLAIAIMCDSDILLLDEPGSYLDDSSKVWLQELISEHLDGRLTIIASNDADDLKYCTTQLNIEDYK